MSKNYYDILGLEKTASWEEIKKAYRKLAMQHHPDRGGDGEVFKEINEAYGVLSDPSKKSQYDTFGSVGWWWNPFGGGFGMDVDLWDIFSQFFWGASRNTSRRKSNTSFAWEDIEEYMHIDLKTSLYGAKETLWYKKYVICDECEWVGGSGKKTCSTCGGGWYVKYRQQTVFGTIEHTGVCETCAGSGETFEQVCKKCHGQKRVLQKVSLDIEIPAGIDDGMVIKISGEGHHGIGGGKSWDLYIRFEVKLNEKSLKREGNDLHFTQDIDVIEAILGTTKEIQIPILGKRSIEIPSGTQVGTIIKLSWDGVKYVDRDKKWDLFIHLDIKIPKKLLDEERKCFEKVAQSKKLNVHNKKGILEKIFW